jgi:hypothetical protein
MELRRWWRGFRVGRYTRALENEVARLREENRALLNSILGIAGVPPVITSERPARGDAGPGAFLAAKENAQKDANGGAVDSAGRSRKNGVARSGAGGPGRTQAAGLGTRRRSWQQITRMMEIEAARKPEPVEGAELPTARFGPVA